MHIKFLMEEPSAEVVLKNILPKILDPKVTFAIYTSKNELQFYTLLSRWRHRTALNKKRMINYGYRRTK